MSDEKKKMWTAKLLIRLGTSMGMVFLILCFIWVFIGNSMPIETMDMLIGTAFLSSGILFWGLYLLDY